MNSSLEPDGKSVKSISFNKVAKRSRGKIGGSSLPRDSSVDLGSLFVALQESRRSLVELEQAYIKVHGFRNQSLELSQAFLRRFSDDLVYFKEFGSLLEFVGSQNDQ